MAEEFLARLIADLRARLDRLEAEKVAVKRALHALEAPRPRARRRDLRQALLRSIEASPGSRASFLALEFGTTAETVNDELRKLEESSEVVKRGLGWERVQP